MVRLSEPRHTLIKIIKESAWIQLANDKACAAKESTCQRINKQYIHYLLKTEDDCITFITDVSYLHLSSRPILSCFPYRLCKPAEKIPQAELKS